MEPKVRVGIKFCGNCNPYIAAGEILESIKSRLATIGEVELVHHDKPGLDFLLVLSGCPVDCAERPSGKFIEIVAAGETVNRTDYPAGEIADQVVEKIISAVRYLQP